MRMVDIKKQSNKYIIETVILVVLVNLLWTFAKQIWPLDVFAPMMASMIFVLVVEITSALVWRWVVQKHHEMLPSFRLLSGDLNPSLHLLFESISSCITILK